MLCFDCSAGARVGVFSSSEDTDSLDAPQKLQTAATWTSVAWLFLDILCEDSFSPAHTPQEHPEKILSVWVEGRLLLHLTESSSDWDLTYLSGWRSCPSPLQVEGISDKATPLPAPFWQQPYSWNEAEINDTLLNDIWSLELHIQASEETKGLIDGRLPVEQTDINPFKTQLI